MSVDKTEPLRKSFKDLLKGRKPKNKTPKTPFKRISLRKFGITTNWRENTKNLAASKYAKYVFFILNGPKPPKLLGTNKVSN